MTYKEITERLTQEGVTLEIFCQQYFGIYLYSKIAGAREASEKMPWLGEVNLVAKQTEDWEGGGQQTLIYHLVAHDVYLSATAFVEYPPDWDEEDENGGSVRQAWDEAHPNDEFIWKYMDSFSPVKPVQKTIIEYPYAPELLE